MALTWSDLAMIQERMTDSAKIPSASILGSAPASIWIASGLAKISAAYGASLIEQSVGAPSQLMSAMDYCRKPLLRSLPVLISMKGRHEDAVSVAQSIVNRGSPASALITGDVQGPAAQLLNAGVQTSCMVSASYPARDSRFVNCGSIFMLSALAYQLNRQAFGDDVIGAVDKDDLAHAFSRAAEGSHAISQGIASTECWDRKQLIILGQGLGSELTLPWQSIFAEAGILTSTCLDLKDYTHGDHLAAVRSNNAIYLVIQQPGTEDMVQIFRSRFGTRFPVLVARLESSGPTRFWESLFYCCNVADALTDLLGYGDERPPKDPTVHSWRGWGRLC
ncbi:MULTISPECIES: hypothetical protein [Pseudomonas]|uniref:SIS domain-containing protein n=1 Tax=Pseudomonas plecoglossicida TaxID=70775 RepID=A0ABX4TUV8_PSEDL|nr:MULTISPECIES: hypothetical protein [Pseudomonas]OAK53355.1 hypothetical protein A3K88_07785 [Pseudomonas putida]PPB16732.1 hypothetical protein HV87_19515 [Pseudomonas aeruginosa]MCL8332359.1 hypothetical protein [Pseudomonas juntendi]MDM1714226.1 hypothetical protein [Pseudomonas sp. 165]MDM3890583.1 hypothetical protein [Pseudomonas juntendi]